MLSLEKAASVNLLLTVPSWPQMYYAAAVALGPSRTSHPCCFTRLVHVNNDQSGMSQLVLVWDVKQQGC